jgi:hypothetical protein
VRENKNEIKKVMTSRRGASLFIFASSIECLIEPSIPEALLFFFPLLSSRVNLSMVKTPFLVRAGSFVPNYSKPLAAHILSRPV